MVTGYFIGRPLPSVSGEATYLFYMGYIRLIHFAAAMIFTVLLLGRIYWACVGNRYSRELFIVPVWRRSWWQRRFHRGPLVSVSGEKTGERHRT
ncbi:Ni/Fe-hydrogenase 1 b-type cytochrome subunit [Salmonella enterica subsp. enterica]|uniref:Ni/Fe-hydrogenase 1 b-type cytochrome subunit n=1 Tax=Salmonella enterica I TaxID=59201 RepID=A0A447U203_SALET|nr:Ni/Fe-hydrogenase 1 b-type cytochrome subunit [Salmonella enterica subsp. enterica]